MSQLCPCGLDDCPLNDPCPVCQSSLCIVLQSGQFNPPTLFGIFDVGEQQTADYKQTKFAILFMYKLMSTVQDFSYVQGSYAEGSYQSIFGQIKSAFCKLASILDICEMNNFSFRQRVNHFIRRGFQK